MKCVMALVAIMVATAGCTVAVDSDDGAGGDATVAEEQAAPDAVDETAEPLASVEDAESSPVDDTPSAVSEQERCLKACKAGIEAIENFCRSLPDPEVRAACWAARFNTLTCIGFCYWYF